MRIRLLMTLGIEPFLGTGLQFVELLAETRQVYKRMQIGRLSRLKKLFRFGKTR